MNIPDIFRAELIMPLVGIFIVIMGSLKLKRYITLRKNGIQVEGIIDELVTEENEGNVTVWPIVRFVTLSGLSIVKKVDITVRSYEKYNEGDGVAVLYNEQDPEKYIIHDNNYINGVYGYLIFGIIITLFGLLGQFSNNSY